MTKAILNWGLLSTADINQALIPPLRNSARNKLEAVASRTTERAKSYAQEWNIPRAFGSYESMLADENIDVIYNALPNHIHAEWTIKAMRAGKHVLCEKPLVLTTAEADEIARVSKETGMVAAEAFMYRHHPQTLKVKEIIDSGILGELQIIRGLFTATFSRAGNYRLNKEMGGGSLWDVGCYPVSYTRFITGSKPVEVFGRQATGIHGTDETFMGQMQFASGVFAQFVCGFVSPFRTSMEIIGSKGTLSIPVPFHPGLFVPGQAEVIYLQVGDEKQTIEIPFTDLYAGEVEDMADVILNGKDPRVSLAESRGHIEMITALFESAETGKNINL